MDRNEIYYSDRYNDGEFEYRHVMLPKKIAKLVPKTHLMSETEWRNLGVQQSPGWIHYMIHEPGNTVDNSLPLELQEADFPKPALPRLSLPLIRGCLIRR
ncbi:cyclin-dependent kinases regulatory subunit 1-like [Chiloscyllium plagiosum]|uniref:cyclin-dependent kinases regulatory subunit 1-like n=1 Tax=Chiloscyllium plagiosum TaxID=36176 RepID=UPI001CB84251|nr:cyclin-dependent kinases regulatory subunit 1-like [Chiloscyllium plagiosum]